MLFNSYSFLIFFPAVVLIYFVVPKKIRYIWLLIASYYFYMSWDPKFAIFLGTSTLITYLGGLFLGATEKSQLKFKLGLKKAIVAVCFTANLGILFYFKYFDFFIDSLNKLLSHFQIQAVNQPFDIILPVGISFYTFQALSYTADIYRGKMDPEKNPLRYALFVSFFPQIISGPIERAPHLLKQMQTMDKLVLWNYENVSRGFTLMLWGYFQKMVIADRIAILVNTVFDNYYMYGSVELFVAAVGFALQIYCDFASYSNIAIGAAKIMGFDIMDNFNTPYFSTSVSDFWKRWHISLSSWFRDYLYIPLGGNRCSKPRQYFNIMVTFLVSGLWHGASWNYIIWGGLNGVYQIVGKITRPLKDKLNIKLHTRTESFSYKFGQALITFLLVDLTWIFFRLDNMADGIYYCKRIFTKFDPWSLFNGNIYTLGLERFEFNILMVCLFVLLLVDLVKAIKNERIDVFLGKQCLWFRWSALFFLLFTILVYGIYGMNFDSSQFIYFQF